VARLRRYYYENNDLQSDNVSSALAGTLQSFNRIEFYKDYGVEGGGPLLRDRLWAWGAYGFTNPALEIYTYRPNAGTVARTGPGCTGNALPFANEARTYNITARDCTELENYSAKINGKLTEAARGSFTYFRGNKQKFGRGASATHPAPTTWNQDGPTDMYKGEVNYTLSNTTFLTGRYAYTAGGFSLEPIGGRTAQTVLDDDGIWQNSYLFYLTDRPQHNLNLDGNYFRGSHEFKFGFGYRKTSVASESGFPGGILTIYDGYPDMIAQVTRDSVTKADTIYWSAFVGDQISRDRLTLNLGVRWDRQLANLGETTVPSNALSSLLPSLTASAQSSVVVYNSVTPRLGLTYALNESRKTIARASYAMFASQLNATRGLVVSQIPATSTGSGYVYYLATDLNGNGIVDPNELGALDGVLGFDPDNPLGGNPDRVGSYKTPKTHEVVLGVEHELRPNLGLSANVTWRKYVDFNWTQYAGVTGSDYIETSRLTGTQVPIGPFDIPIYTVNPTSVPDDFGRIHEVRNGYSQRYLGFEVAATKRMSDNWMMRVGYSTNRHQEYFDSIDAMADPTPTLPTAALPLNGPNKDGGVVVLPTSGSGKGNIYLAAPKYQYIMNAAYQAKWNITVGMNYVFRQGYALPYYQGSAAGSADDLASQGKSVLLVPDVDDYRLPNVHSLDGRISWAWRYRARYGVNLDLDIFNMFNNSTVLGRQINRATTGFNQAREIMNPRIIRLGARFNF
jgi:hypothetical protein